MTDRPIDKPDDDLTAQDIDNLIARGAPVGVRGPTAFRCTQHGIVLHGTGGFSAPSCCGVPMAPTQYAVNR